MSGVFRLAEQAAAETHRSPYRLESVGVQFLRHESDHGARRPRIADDIVAADRDVAGAQIIDAANDADQRGLAGAVRSEQREDLALLDLQIDVLQRLEAGAIGF